MLDGTEKLPTPNSHVDGENSAKTIVYNTKRKMIQRKGYGRKTKKNERLKKYNSKKKEL